MVRYPIKHDYPRMIGDGLAMWNQVHVGDLARAYVALLQWLEQTPGVTVAESPYFFCENGEELLWRQCAEEIGRILHKAGKVADPIPQTIPRENYRDLFGECSGLVIGSNARNRANRLRKIGEFKGYAASVASSKFEGKK
ncbi:hypothetical protein BDV06DRAFT_228978 [Aspergillus oleicola]